jgi:HopA1 effector protein family
MVVMIIVMADFSTKELIYKELEGLVKSVKLNSPTLYEYNNHLFKHPRLGNNDDSTHNKLSNNVPSNSKSNTQNSIKLDLADLLYYIYHCRNESVLLLQQEQQDNFSFSYSNYYTNDSHQDFTLELSRANSGSGTWEGGWRIVKIKNNNNNSGYGGSSSGQLLAVRKNGLTLWVGPNHFKSMNGSSISEIGKTGKIRMVREYRRLFPGFYMANSNSPYDSDDNSENNDITVRFYWNIRRLYAAILMKYVTTELNSINVPFKFKILSNPYYYPRSDAAVLYIHKKYYNNIKNHISGIYEKVKLFLDSPTSLFAKKLANGLSLAEDPGGNEESFGKHRSSILAKSLHLIREKNINSVEEAIEQISSYFSKMGIDLLQKPFLNPNSVDDYDIVANNYYSNPEQQEEHEPK